MLHVPLSQCCMNEWGPTLYPRLELTDYLQYLSTCRTWNSFVALAIKCNIFNTYQLIMTELMRRLTTVDILYKYFLDSKIFVVTTQVAICLYLCVLSVHVCVCLALSPTVFWFFWNMLRKWGQQRLVQGKTPYTFFYKIPSISLSSKQSNWTEQIFMIFIYCQLV